jgi:hypothetical protein
MIGLGGVVYPQWRDHERLAFPLLRVYHALIDEPPAGGLFPAVFRSRLFWVGCGLVLFIHSSNGLAIFSGGAFPAIPVSGNLSAVFTEGVWRYAPGFLQQPRIYFLFIGLAYFMPNRYSFSIWFTVFFFGMVVMVARAYAPTFSEDILYDQGAGALLALVAGVVWLGRQHYGRVLRAALGRAPAEEAGRSEALLGRWFLGGAAVMLGWFVWAGAGIGWSVFFVVFGIMIMLIVARIVAETGLTFVWIIPLTAARLIGLLPSEWVTVSVAFLQQAMYILINRASAVSVAAMTVLACGLNHAASPASRRSLAGTGLLVLGLGLVVCGAVHLHMGYTLATSLDGVNTPITGRGALLMGLNPVINVVTGRQGGAEWQNYQAILFGLAVAGGLLFLCSRFPGWPLHPIGLIFVHSSIGLRLVVSLFLGWLIKVLIVQYAGARAYRGALPFFLGLILGEILANALWTLAPVILLLLGREPNQIPHMIIFQYT